ncbi:hypothetical protein B4U80_00815 [Leptotrombidium deliense]|uniref:TGF-beta propeptide domain-containing protein n=1 Tax=Leptotrombidium deliense TaxID=299467 RepID=A0A443SJ11_9ACAR|nr:hypothetical protein B4U80_00815 [Leptotrombidium deliense]
MHEKITQFTCQLLALLTVFAVCRSRSTQPRPNFVDSSPAARNETVEQLFSKALTEEKLEDALKLFLEQWETRHGQKRGNRSISDEMMQADYPLVVPPSVWTRKRQVNPNSLLATGEPSKEHTNEDLSVDETEEGSKVNCTRCVMHEEARQRRLEEIKFDILNKLGMKQAPNVTSKTLPRIPPLHHLFDKYGILGDDPQTLSSSSRPTQDLDEEQMHSDQPMDADEEFEDFYVNTERAISFAQKCKSSKLVLPYFVTVELASNGFEKVSAFRALNTLFV